MSALTARQFEVLQNVAETGAWGKAHSDIKKALRERGLVEVDGKSVKATDAGLALLDPEYAAHAEGALQAAAEADGVTPEEYEAETERMAEADAQPADVDEDAPLEIPGAEGDEARESVATLKAAYKAAIAAGAEDADAIATLVEAADAALQHYAVPSLSILSGVGRPALHDLLHGKKGQERTVALVKDVTRRVAARERAGDSIVLKVPGKIHEYLVQQIEGVEGKRGKKARAVIEAGERKPAGAGFYVVVTIGAAAAEDVLDVFGTIAERAKSAKLSGPEKVGADILARRVAEHA